MHQVFYKSYKGNSPPLSWDCCDQSQDIIQYLLGIDEDLVNMHPEYMLTAIQEFHMHPSYHKNMDEPAEEENSQETVDILHDIPEKLDADPSSLAVEASDDILPQIQSSKETKS